MKKHWMMSAAGIAIALAAGPAYADMNAAKSFLDAEIKDQSSLTRADQEKEMQWFIDAAKPFAGMEIKVVSENITTHDYESKVLAKAFSDITGIKLTHDIIGEGDVIEKLQTQMQSGENIYDAYVNDSDLIGTHWRYNQVRNLTDWMAGDGKDVTSPTLDIADFIGTSFTTAPDKKLYQLPDQQFANLYWFRYDWFNDEKNKADFKKEYGYDLGVPVNWSAYEDIAKFFTGREIDGKKVYGHMDYGKKDPSLGWRFTDAWLSMAGNGDKGLPNGLPSTNGASASTTSRSRSARASRAAATPTARRRLLDREIPRVAEGLCAAAGTGHDLLRVRSGSGAGRDRAADLLVHGLHGRCRQEGSAGGQRGRHAEMAHGPLPARRLLGRRHEARLSGRRLLDADAVHPDRARQGRLALRPVRHLQDGGREEEPHGPHLRA